jgi:hypothetical protein
VRKGLATIPSFAPPSLPSDVASDTQNTTDESPPAAVLSSSVAPEDTGDCWDGIEISNATPIAELRDSLAVRLFNRNAEHMVTLDSLLSRLSEFGVDTVGTFLQLEERDRDMNELDKKLPGAEHEMFHRVTGRLKTLPFIHESIVRAHKEENSWDGIEITLSTLLLDLREPLAKRLFGRSAEQDALLDALLATLSKLKILTVGELLAAEERDRYSNELEGALKLDQHEMFYRVGGRIKTLPFILRQMERAEAESQRAGKKKMPRAAGGRNDRVRHIREFVDFAREFFADFTPADLFTGLVLVASMCLPALTTHTKLEYRWSHDARC